MYMYMYTCLTLDNAYCNVHAAAQWYGYQLALCHLSLLVCGVFTREMAFFYGYQLALL